VFIKHEVLKPLGGTKILELDVNDPKIQHSLMDVFVGSNTRKLLLDQEKQDSKDPIETRLSHQFREKVHVAFVDSAGYILKKFPLKNKLLKCLSAIDPKVQGNSVTCQILRRLSEYFPTVVTDTNSYEAGVKISVRSQSAQCCRKQQTCEVGQVVGANIF
jgi:hypothetical protein